MSRASIPPEQALVDFGDDSEWLAPLWMKLESALGVPSGKLRLTDRFEQELRASARFALYHPEADLLEDLQEHFPSEKLQIATVADFCRQCLCLKKRLPEGADLGKEILG